MSCLMLAWMLTGCHARLPDVPADAARLTGIDNAIVFREWPEPIDPAALARGSLLTPAQAVRLALTHDPRIQSSLAHVRMAEADANQARLLPNPILTIDLRYPLTHSNVAFEPSLTADLLSLLQKPAQISAADHRLRESAATALTTVLDVISEVEEAYAAARSVDSEIEKAQRRQQRLQRLRDLSQKRLVAGEATRLDVLTLDAQLMQSILEVADFDLQHVEQRLILARLVGQPRSDAQWQLSPWEPPAAGSLAPESRWVDAALCNRPEISARVWELRALGDEVKGAAIPPIQGGEIGVHGEHDPEWRVGPSFVIPLPIFDFGQATRAKVKAERIAARHDLAQQQLEVIQNVRLAYAGLVHSRKALADAQQMLLPLQQKQLDQARLSYEAGEADLATLLLAENDFELTATKIVELQEKVTVAWSKLQRAAGGAGVADRLSVATRPTEQIQDDPVRQAKPEPATQTMPANDTQPATAGAQAPTSQPATGPVR